MKEVFFLTLLYNNSPLKLRSWWSSIYEARSPRLRVDPFCLHAECSLCHLGCVSERLAKSGKLSNMTQGYLGECPDEKFVTDLRVFIKGEDKDNGNEIRSDHWPASSSILPLYGDGVPWHRS